MLAVPAASLAFPRLQYWHSGLWQRPPYLREVSTNASWREYEAVACGNSFGKQCPQRQDVTTSNHRRAARGHLIFSMLGHVTNCLMQVNLARWLADLLNKTVVLPLCAEGSGCFGSLRYANISSVWNGESLSRCRSVRSTAAAAPLALAHAIADGARPAVCLAQRAEHCATEQVSAAPHACQPYHNLIVGCCTTEQALLGGNKYSFVEACRPTLIS